MRFWRKITVGLGVLVLATTALTADSVAQVRGPVEVTRYSLVLDGTEIGAFGELVSLTSEAEANPPKEGYIQKSGYPLTVYKSTVVLRRALNSSLELWAWHELARQADPKALRNASLVMYSAEGKAVFRFHLVNAWPSKIQVGGEHTGASQVLTETVTIAVENIQRVSA